MASEVLDLIMGALESFLEEAFKPIEKTLSSLLPCKNYVKYLVSDVEYLVARRVTLVIAFHFLPPNLGQLMATYECYFVIQQVAFQSNANHPLGESIGYIKFEGCRYFTLTLM